MGAGGCGCQGCRGVWDTASLGTSSPSCPPPTTGPTLPPAKPGSPSPAPGTDGASHPGSAGPGSAVPEPPTLMSRIPIRGGLSSLTAKDALTNGPRRPPGEGSAASPLLPPPHPGSSREGRGSSPTPSSRGALPGAEWGQKAGPVPNAGTVPWPEPSEGTICDPVGNPPADDPGDGQHLISICLLMKA